MKRCTLLMPLVIFMAIAMLLLWQLARNVEGDDPNSLESALIGKPVPIFRLEALEDPGQHFQSDALAQGKPLLLNVWATWCPTCRAEHQYLNQLSAGDPRGGSELQRRSAESNWLAEHAGQSLRAEPV
jgi:cytochrome c biogenesis protein CcmG/thiol:disulfide interchange protein DsbE